MTNELLRVVLAAELAVLAIVLIGFAGGALRTAWHRRRVEPALLAARKSLASALATGEAEPSPMLRALSPARRLELLMDMAPSISGAQLQALAHELGVLELAAGWCRSRRWWRRLRGARVFTELGGGTTVVPALLNDPHPEVRAEAAIWMGSHPTAERLRRLAPLLGDHAAVTRSTAADALLRTGRAAVPALTSFLRQPKGDGTALALVVARGLAEPRLLPDAQRYTLDPDPTLRRLATDLLARIGGSGAAVRLDELLGDPDPSVRAAACSGIARLDAWDLAPRVSRLLVDPEWSVRRSAALALAALGAPGRLCLRQASRAGLADVASMASRALAVEDPRAVLER